LGWQLIPWNLLKRHSTDKFTKLTTGKALLELHCASGFGTTRSAGEGGSDRTQEGELDIGRRHPIVLDENQP
jgi:hypothetical protein